MVIVAAERGWGRFDLIVSGVMVKREVVMMGFFMYFYA